MDSHDQPAVSDERSAPPAAGTESGRRAALAKHWPLAVILVLYAGLALAFNLATPVGEAPDETTHFEYVLHVRRTGQLPVIPKGPGSGLAQSKHPPLYYLLGVALSSWADLDTLGFMHNPHFTFNFEDPPSPVRLVHFAHERFPYTEAVLAARLMRLASLLSGLIVVAATYALGRTVRADAPHVAWGAAAAVAFVPGFAFFGGVFNNDAMAAAWTALALVGGARVALGHAGRRDLVALGVVLGLGLMTKLTTVGALAPAGLGVAIHAWRTRDWRCLPRAAVAAGAPVVVIAGWWFARNMALYGVDDPLAWRRWLTKVPTQMRVVPLRDELGAYFYLQFVSFWGRFGWTTIDLPRLAYQALAIVSALGVAGLALLVARRWRALPADARWGLALTGLTVAILYLSVFRLALRFTMVVAHGRYLYIALAGLGVLLVTGITELVPRAARTAAALTLAGALLALSVYSVAAVVAPTFRPPAPLSAAEVAAVERRVDVDFEDKVRLVGLDLDAERVVAGGDLTVTLYWQSLRAFWTDFIAQAEKPEGHVIFLHLLDASGEVVGRVDAPPFGGDYPTLGWPPGAVLAETFGIPVSETAVPGRATLLVGLYRAGRPGDRLAASGAGVGLGDGFRLERLVIRPPGPAAAGPGPGMEAGRDDVFTVAEDDDLGSAADWVLLAGAAVEAGQESVEVTLHWQPSIAVDRDYTVFVHLVDAAGRPVATGDGPPQLGRYPTSLWEPGESVPDSHVLDLPASLPAGRYEVLAGWYDLTTGRRLPARSADGGRWPDDSVVIGGLCADAAGALVSCED